MRSEKWRHLLSVVHRESFRRGEFTLASGLKSDFYIDIRQTSTHPEGAALIGDLILERVEQLAERPKSVGGLALGAVPVAIAVTSRSVDYGVPLASFMVRKEVKDHGAGRRIDGHIVDGDAIVVVEDTITTGGSTLKAVEAIREDYPNCRIVQVIAVVDREDGGRAAIEAAGLPFDALITRSDLFAYDDELQNTPN
ncbi:MAG: orotate phosphoribosyltransferase [Deltaproteobacteria bacterium]|nr:orotate phosphoribosyltransferase [Deltaproteobacteria bacterium]